MNGVCRSHLVSHGPFFRILSSRQTVHLAPQKCEPLAESDPLTEWSLVAALLEWTRHQISEYSAVAPLQWAHCPFCEVLGFEWSLAAALLEWTGRQIAEYSAVAPLQWANCPFLRILSGRETEPGRARLNQHCCQFLCKEIAQFGGHDFNDLVFVDFISGFEACKYECFMFILYRSEVGKTPFFCFLFFYLNVENVAERSFGGARAVS
ncbi:hypothetical protein BJ741DRAFT_86507 [Chytriomyces cf. hyalinus JEL632]|nr:hypothetical protein BJ741DRAFT_86507 [Chytriomyces cf. hyalinus JEL632]